MKFIALGLVVIFIWMACVQAAQNKPFCIEFAKAKENEQMGFINTDIDELLNMRLRHIERDGSASVGINLALMMRYRADKDADLRKFVNAKVELEQFCDKLE